jgi:hypothetical protein
VHTPSAESFSLFDRVLLLACGRLLWQGPARDGGVQADAFFCDAACERPAYRPVVEHFLFAAIEMSARDEPHAAVVTAEPAAAEPASAASDAEARPGSGGVPGAPPLPAQLRALLWRELLRVRRSPALLGAHLAIASGLALWLGGVYYQLDLTIVGFQNRLGLFFLILATFSFSGLSAAGSLLGDDSLLRAEAHRAYHPAAYCAARLLTDFVLLRAVPAGVHASVVYRLVGLQPDTHRFGTFVSIVVLHAVGASALAHLVASCAPSSAVSTLVTSFILLQSTVFGGLLTSTAALPAWVAWLRYTSLSFYSFEAAVGNELNGLVFELGIDTIQGVRFTGQDLLTSALQLHTQPGPDLICELVWVLFAAVATVLAVAVRYAPRGV